MKNLLDVINEVLNKEGMFMGKTSRRTQEDFKFNTGEKVMLIKFDTDGYEAYLRGVFEIDKVTKNFIKLKSDEEFYTSKKFDKYGICVVKEKNRYRGNSTAYWVLYNAELAHEEEIDQLLTRGSCTWGFKVDWRQDNYNDRLQEMIDKITK